MDIFIGKTFYDYYERRPIKLIDVGASGGLQDNWRRAGRHLELVGFEPDARSFHDLKKGESSKKIYIDKALYNEKKTVDFYLTNKKEASSVFAPNKNFLKQFPEPERFYVSEISKLEVDSLDRQLEKHNINDADFIKLDTNGSELHILEGAERILKSHIFGIEIEVEFSQVYEGQPLFSDVDKFVRNFGFQLFDIKAHYWKRDVGKSYGGLKGQLIFADALYLLSLEGIEARLTNIQDRILAKSKALKYISIAFLYGYVDYGIAIFEKNKKFFDSEEVGSFYKEVKKDIHMYLPHFRGKGRLAKAFKFLYNALRYNYNGWSITQESLGNIE